MSNFDLGHLDTFTSFIAGVKTVNRLGDDSTPVDGRRSLAADGAAILYHCPWFVLGVRSGYNRDRWDDFAAKVYNMALATREACRKPALKATAFYGLKAHVSIGQLAMGETSFHPSQLPDSVLAGFGIKVQNGSPLGAKADLDGWVAEQLRLSEAHRAFAAQVTAQRKAGRSITMQEVAPSRLGFPSVRVLGDGNDRRLTFPGLKVAIPAYTGR